MRRTYKHLMMAAAVAGLSASAVTHAQTGVSDNRVSLPDGPGSMEGVGDDVSVSGNMGALSYSIAMPMPFGHPGVSGSMSLQYSSAGGPGVVGTGWSMPMPAIERLTVRGVPTYDVDDEFTADGGQLVYVGGSNPREYRERFEGRFVRYRWYDAGDGTGGYWTAEYPDGRVAYFGADEGGDLESDARVGGDDGVFRYHMVETVDVWDNSIRYNYGTYGTTALVESIEWAFVDGAPKHVATFDYEAREDVVIDATGGFVERLEHRLTSVEAFVNGTSVDRWDMQYEPYAESGGFSRLEAVQRYGLGGEPYETNATFGYSTALGEICADASCTRPFVRDLGTLGVDLSSGDPQLVDINGDALPDIVDSTLTGAPHRIFLNTITADGEHYFADPYDSAVGEQDGFDFSNPRIQVLDVNGDGFTDAINAGTGAMLINLGEGDWSSESDAWDGAVTLPDFENPATLATLRFIDIDNDRRIDLLRASGSGGSHVTQVFRNTGSGYEEIAADDVGAGFDSETLEVNDFNGDGLVDVAQILTTGVRYRLNLGHGNWYPEDDWLLAEYDTEGLEASETDDADLDDLNGDGMADLALVRGTTVEVWINRAGLEYEYLGAITNDDVDSIDGAEIPTNGASTTVLYADVNANGSTDVVWVTASGEVTFLELFPVRPNLLSTVSNGIGRSMTVTYGTSVEQAAMDAADGAPWPYALPFANLVVTSVTTTDAVTGVETLVEYAYSNGFYDGIEKQFRGYESIVTAVLGDEWAAGSTTYETYSLGVDDPYAAGPLVESLLFDDTDAPLQERAFTYGDCPVDVDDDGALFDVRHWCLLETVTVDQEGADASEWQVQRESFTYDGYGNVIERIDEGVVTIGGSSDCGPCDRDADLFGQVCGEGCLGDEAYARTTYIEPGDATGDAWIVGRVSEEYVYADAAMTEIVHGGRILYDGDDFEGLPLGELTRGFESRSEVLLDDGTWAVSDRNRADEHGNIAENLGNEGSPTEPGNRNVWSYDESGLYVQSVVAEVDADTRLRRDYTWDELHQEATELVDWYREGSSDALLTTRYAYDAFGRLVSSVRPGGDTELSPTVRYTYTPSATGGYVESWMRPESGADAERYARICVDGSGRALRTFSRIDDNEYRVGSHMTYGRTGEPVIEYDPYVTSSADCDTPVPDGIGYVEFQSDAMGRTTRQEYFGSDGTSRVNEMRFAPGIRWTYEATDLDPTHPHFDTPIIERVNGRGELWAVGRMLEADGDIDWWTMTWSPAGRLTEIIDPAGNVRTQTWDMRGRLVSAEDPDRGLFERTWSDNGLLVAEIDATGTIRYAYDGAGRLVEQWVDGDRDGTLVTITWDGSDQCPDDACTFAANEVVSMSFPTPVGDFTDWYGYNAVGAMIRAERITPMGTFVRGWDYNQLGDLVGQTLPGGRSVELTYDDAGRLASVPGYIDGIGFSDAGDPNRLEYANGVAMTIERDAFRRYGRVTVDGPDGAIVDRTTAYDADGRVTSVLDALADGTTPSASAAYTYDGFSRLTSATFDPGTGIEEAIAYEFDAIDNILSRTSSLGDASPVHDGDRTIDGQRPHAIASMRGMDFAYDAAGRVTQRGELTTTWDGFGRAAAYGDADGDFVTVGYALEDRVVEVRADGGLTFLLGNDFEITDGVASYLPMVGDATAARHEFVDLATTIYPDVAPVDAADDTISSADAWVAYAAGRGYLEVDVDSGFADRVLVAAAAQSLVEFGDRLTWLHRDVLSNLAAVTDEDGRVVEAPLFYPFGMPRGTVSNRPDDRDFGDMRRDAQAQAIHFPQRDYDPLAGRWMQPDLAFAVVTPNELTLPWESFGAYSYLMNGPTLGTDPTGATFEPAQYDDVLQVESLYMDTFSDNTLTALTALDQAYTVLQRLGVDTGSQDTFSRERLTAFITTNADEISKIRQARVYQPVTQNAALRGGGLQSDAHFGQVLADSQIGVESVMSDIVDLMANPAAAASGDTPGGGGALNHFVDGTSPAPPPSAAQMNDSTTMSSEQIAQAVSEFNGLSPELANRQGSDADFMLTQDWSRFRDDSVASDAPPPASQATAPAQRARANSGARNRANSGGYRAFGIAEAASMINRMRGSRR